MQEPNPILGILREQKTPAERRAPLSPEHCARLLDEYPGMSIYVQPCADRCFLDADYAHAGAIVQEEMPKGALLFGVKERKPETIEPGRTYVIFSHVIKKQPYNQSLLEGMLAKEATLMDYECIVDERGSRLVAFGYFAGVVGALHGLRMYGLKTGRFVTKPPRECKSMFDSLMQIPKGGLDGFKVVLTGNGRVSSGARQVLEHAGLKQVDKATFLSTQPTEGGYYTQLSSMDMYMPIDGVWMGSQHFYQNPNSYHTGFSPFVNETDLLITGHFWNENYPRMFAPKDLAAPGARLKVIADISCDIGGSVPVTIRPSTIEEPYYDIDPMTTKEAPAFSLEKNVTIMAVDNLPCEMPADASRHFGDQLVQYFIPDILAGGPVSTRASITKDGQLTPDFEYLADWVAKKV